MMPAKINNNFCKISHRFCLNGSLLIYGSIIVFFIALYWLKPMTGEDISQSAASSRDSLIETTLRIYHYIPRIGELYQHLIIRYYEPLARLNLYLIPRLIDVLLAAIFLYVLTWFALCHRPPLDLRSGIAVAIIFIIMIVTQANVIFMARFSCLHNYVLGYLIPVIFVLPFASYFLNVKRNISTAQTLGHFMLGVLTGYSTEVTPIILLFLLSSVVLIAYKNKRIIETWMTVSLSGLLIGIMLFYGSGGLNSRIYGPYANAHEYIFNRNIHGASLALSVLLFLSHFGYNARYLWPALLFFASSSLVYFTLSKTSPDKSDRSTWLKRGSLVLCFLVYSLIYLAISSVIRVNDALYGRFMVGIYICLAVTVAQLGETTIFQIFPMDCKKIKMLINILAAMIIVIGCDMFYGFNKYNLKCQQIIGQLKQRSSIPISASELRMDDSPLFNFHQDAILEPWANKSAFGVTIQYIDDDDEK